MTSPSVRTFVLLFLVYDHYRNTFLVGLKKGLHLFIFKNLVVILSVKSTPL